jgi:PAS domain S-box-containing protein
MIAGEPTKVAVGRVPDDMYRMFVERVRHYAMFFLDRSGHVASWNDGAEIMKGYQPEEILGKHFSVFYPKSSIDARRPQFELQVATMDGRYEDEGWRVRKDGSLFWANVVIISIKHVDGTLLGFAKITRDLTDKRNQEQALRESEERYRIFVNSIRDYAVFMLDPQGRVVTWNEGAQRMKGYAAEEIVGRSFEAFYTPEDLARRHPQEELELAEKQGSYEEEGWRVRKDGSRFRARVTITAVRDENGTLRGFAKVTREIAKDAATHGTG